MRIQPIENPRGLKMKLIYALCRRRFGKVVTPLKVVSARVPEVLPVYKAIARFMTRPEGLDPSLRILIQAWTADQNQCGFCLDLTRSFAAYDPELLEKVWRVQGYATDPVFSDAERAALAYVAAVTETRTADDATFAALRQHYSDREIVEITLVNAVENFYNLVNRPLGIESDGLCALRPRPAAANAAPRRA
jgi:alkylhydroperoxidase family enzyme